MYIVSATRYLRKEKSYLGKRRVGIEIEGRNEWIYCVLREVRCTVMVPVVRGLSGMAQVLYRTTGRCRGRMLRAN